MFCEKCGARLEAEDLFCGECGAEIEPAEIDPVISGEETGAVRDNIKTTADQNGISSTDPLKSDKEAAVKEAMNGFKLKFDQKTFLVMALVFIYCIYQFAHDGELTFGNFLFSSIVCFAVYVAILYRSFRLLNIVDRKNKAEIDEEQMNKEVQKETQSMAIIVAIALFVTVLFVGRMQSDAIIPAIIIGLISYFSALKKGSQSSKRFVNKLTSKKE